MMEKREGEIKSSLDNASAAKQEAAALKAAYTDKLKTAEAAAGDIIKSAKEEAKAKRDEIISKAKEDAGNIVLNANKQIELEKERSISEAKSDSRDGRIIVQPDCLLHNTYTEGLFRRYVQRYGPLFQTGCICFDGNEV